MERTQLITFTFLFLLCSKISAATIPPSPKVEEIKNDFSSICNSDYSAKSYFWISTASTVLGMLFSSFSLVIDKRFWRDPISLVFVAGPILGIFFNGMLQYIASGFCFRKCLDLYSASECLGIHGIKN